MDVLLREVDYLAQQTEEKLTNVFILKSNAFSCKAKEEGGNTRSTMQNEKRKI